MLPSIIIEGGIIMKFNLILFEGTDSIKFGMTSKEVQSIMKIKPEFSKSRIDFDIERYPGICEILYEPNKDDIFVCAEIEFYKPTEVFFEGIELMGRPTQEIVDLFKRRFEDYAYDVTAKHRSEKYGIGFSGIDNPRRKDVVQIVDISRIGFRGLYNKLYDEKYASIETTKVREYECLNCKATYSSEDPTIKCAKCNVFMIPKN
jgi:hypothetical protein